MENKKFNYLTSDAQGTAIQPVSISDFDIECYVDYEAALLEKNKKFWSGEDNIAVYRRFRVPQVFSYGCKDMKLSLELQLAALNASMDYKADIANFLEPWYGIGTIASCFGCEYIWDQDKAPAFKPVFETVENALDYIVTPADETRIGKHTLEMIEYFLDKTQGKLPMSLTDLQSPLNVASEIIDINNFPWTKMIKRVTPPDYSIRILFCYFYRQFFSDKVGSIAWTKKLNFILLI